MDKTLAGLIGAAGALAASASAQAATVGHPGIEEAMHAGSYADLLKPIPNAAALLRASDAAQAEAALGETPASVFQVQYYHHHHHHHHHHRYYRRPILRQIFHPRYHHHHHHHHHGPEIVIPFPR
jgi:hypothetical protein